VADAGLIADEGEHLTAGWEPDLPAEDSIQRQAILGMAARAAHQAAAVGRPYEDDGVLAMASASDLSLWTSQATILQPLVDVDPFDARTRDFFGDRPHIVFSAWPTPDLRPIGYQPVGHPPLMLRPAGTPPPSVADVDIVEANDAAGVEAYERVFIHGYPAPEFADAPPGSLFHPDTLKASEFGELRYFVGRLAGEPVAVAAAWLSHGLVEVEFVATLPAARGKGFGAAITWAATAGGDGHAVLLGSDDGQPVYERLGYLRLERWTAWAKV